MTFLNTPPRGPGGPEVVALHEAAHAIIAVKFGLHISKCTVTPDGKRFAHVELVETYDLPDIYQQATPPEILRLELYARQSFAGHAAEMKKFGPRHTPGSDDDIADMRSFADHIYPAGSDHSRWMAKCMTLGKRDVDKYWHAIEVLAEEILRLGDRTHADVVAVIARTGV